MWLPVDFLAASMFRRSRKFLNFGSSRVGETALPWSRLRRSARQAWVLSSDDDEIVFEESEEREAFFPYEDSVRRNRIVT